MIMTLVPNFTTVEYKLSFSGENIARKSGLKCSTKHISLFRFILVSFAENW